MATIRTCLDFFSSLLSSSSSREKIFLVWLLFNSVIFLHTAQLQNEKQRKKNVRTHWKTIPPFNGQLKVAGNYTLSCVCVFLFQRLSKYFNWRCCDRADIYNVSKYRIQQQQVSIYIIVAFLCVYISDVGPF